MDFGSESVGLKTSRTFILAVLALTGLLQNTVGQQSDDTVLTNTGDSLTYSLASSHVTEEFKITELSSTSVIQIMPTDGTPVSNDIATSMTSTGVVGNSNSDFDTSIINTYIITSSSSDESIQSSSTQLVTPKVKTSSSSDESIQSSSTQLVTSEVIASSSLEANIQSSSAQTLSLETVASSSSHSGTPSISSEIISSSIDSSVQSFSSDIIMSPSLDSSTYIFSPDITGSSTTDSSSLILVDSIYSEASSTLSPHSSSIEPVSPDYSPSSSSATITGNDFISLYTNVSTQTASPAEQDSITTSTPSSIQLETTQFASPGIITSDIISTTNESSNFETSSMNLESSTLGAFISTILETPVLSSSHASLPETSSENILSSLKTPDPSPASDVPQTQEMSTSDHAAASPTSDLHPEAASSFNNTSDMMTTALLTMTSLLDDTPSASSSTAALTDSSPGSFSPGATSPDASVTLETTDTAPPISVVVTQVSTSAELLSTDVNNTGVLTFSHGPISTTPADILSETLLINPTPTEIPLTSYIATDVTAVPGPSVTPAESASLVSTETEFGQETTMGSISFVVTNETTLPSPAPISSVSYSSAYADSLSWNVTNNTQDMMTNVLESSYLSGADLMSHTTTDSSLLLIDSTPIMFSSLSGSPYPPEFFTPNNSFEISSVIPSNSNIIDMSTVGIFTDLSQSSSFSSTYLSLIDTSYLTSYLDSSKLVSLLSSEWLMSSMPTDLLTPTSGTWTAESTISTVASDTFSSLGSLTITASFNWTISTGGIIEPTQPLTPTQDVSTAVAIQDNSSLLIISTVVPVSLLSSTELSPTPVSSIILSSSVLPATTPATGTTLATIENSRNKTDFWVVTRFKVRPSVDILSAEFKNSIEKGLANAFYLSRIRNEEKINGTYVPLKRKRAASADADPGIQVEVVSLTRPESLTIAATYVVQENGQLVSAQQATDRLNLLSSQEMAIQTGQVVSLTAEPYIKPAGSEDNTKWIILGCVVGGVLLIAIIIFILCCCCGCRCCQGKVEEKPVTMEGVKSYVDDEPEARRKSFALNSKKGKYAVSSEVEDEALYASIKPKGNKKMMSPQISDEKSETDLEERPAKKLRQDTPQKKRRKKALDTNEELRSVYESQMASLQTRAYSDGEFTLTSQPTVEEEGDLLENAEEERKKNKQRLREKKRTGQESPNLDSTAKAYDSAQREIDKVLGPRLSHEDSKEKKTKKKKEVKGNDNEGFVGDEHKEDTLEEARQKMHKLLDDAFSLISHSKSSISNKVQPVLSIDESSSMTSKQNTPREDRSVQANTNSPATEEKKHTPLKVQRSHEPYDSSGLVTWSPYRASDEIAVISLPQTQTNLSSQPPQQERLTTSTFNESAPPSKRTSYFATQPGEPIIIRTKDVDGSKPPSGNQKQKILNGDSLQHPADGSRKHHETFQNPMYENTLPLRTMDSYSEPYHGLASYQDLPVSHLTDNGRKISNGRPPIRQSAWQEERSKLGNMGLPLSASSSPRDTIDVRHAAPQRGERKHYDEVDVIKESLRPGASPQPLINSLREELQMLSSKKQGGTTSSMKHSGNGETVKMKTSEPGRRSFTQGDSESSWGSMHRNTSNV